MKKLMIAAAIVCAAAFAQAASIAWGSLGVQTTGDFETGEGDYASGYAVYLFNNIGGYTQSQMTALFAAGDGGWQDAFAEKEEGGYYYIGNIVADGDGAFMPTAAPVADGDFNGYLVIFDADTIENAEYAFVSGIYSAEDNDVHTMKLDYDGETWINALDYSTKDGWYSASVPEPTTGLLMLLGMAGLALRRRRA